jgi:hypothetical protein
LCFCLGPILDHDLPNSASFISGITGVNHHTQS